MVILWMNDSWCYKRKSNYWLSIKEIRQPPCTRVAEISITILRENILSLKSQLIKYCMESGKCQKGSFWCSKFRQLRGDGSQLGFLVPQSRDLDYINHTRVRDSCLTFSESNSRIFARVTSLEIQFSPFIKSEILFLFSLLIFQFLCHTNS